MLPAKTSVNAENVVPLKNAEACLDGLPEELLVDITARLYCSHLLSLRLTSKRYNRLVNVELFSYMSDQQPGPKVISVAESSELAKNVKEIELRYGTNTNINLRTRALHNASNVRKAKLNDYASLGTYAGNLKRVDWIHLFRIPEKHDLAKPFPFGCLTHLEFSGGRLCPISLSNIVQLPCLISLGLYGTVSMGPLADWTLNNSSCNIREFEIRNFHPDDFRTISS